MKDSSKNKPAEEIIDKIITALDEKLLSSRIDEPLEQARKSFSPVKAGNCDNKRIHMILSDFYQAVHEKMYHDNTAACDCLMEVLTLLEKHYKGNLSDGYIAAMMDSRQGDNGIEIVLHRLADIIKTTEREKYVCGVFSTYIDPGNWRLKCNIVEVLQRKYKKILPPNILACKPEQLVDEIPTLMNVVMNSSAIVEQIPNSC